jgi:hypothetical protein
MDDRIVPATFTVTNLSDGGAGSLRQAITDANALAGADAIVFDPSLVGQTIALGTALPAIADSLTVTGLGQSNLSVKGTSGIRVFQVNTGVAATITDLTVTGGNVAGNGGGILNNGSLTLQRVTVSGNAAPVSGNGASGGNRGGGLANIGAGASLTIQDCTVSGNTAYSGGGIENDVFATASISHTVVTGNTAGDDGNGGGVENRGEMTITDSTISFNIGPSTKATPNFFGGGLANLSIGTLTLVSSTVIGNVSQGRGGGLFSEGSLLTVINCTVANNTSVTTATGIGGGGIGVQGGGLTVINSTITGNLDASGSATTNAGGIGFGSGSTGAFFMTNTVVAQNLTTTIGATAAPDVRSDVAVTAANNFIGSDPNALSNVPASQTNLGDPQIGPLQNNGGLTLTRLPLPGSPLIDAGDSAFLVPVSEVQTVKVTGLSGSFTLTFQGQTTASFPSNPTAAAVQTALNALSTIGGVGGSVAVTAVGGTYTVTFGGTLANTNVHQMKASFTGGVVVGVATTTEGRSLPQTTDQRGLLRVVGPAVDVGAAEFQPSAVTVTLTSSTNPATVGSPMAFTATVTPTAAAPANVPTGSVVFTVDGLTVATSTLSAAGTATFTTTTLSVGTHTVRADYAGDANFAAASVVLTPGEQVNLRPTGLVGSATFAAGLDRGFTAAVRVFNPDATEKFSVTPFGVTFTGGARVAVADFNGDGVPDLAVGTGPGSATQVRVFDGATQAELFSIAPFEAIFTGGVFVAAGDLTGDGKAELIITPDEGGGPRCRVFGGGTFTQLADFFGIDDPNFRGGARAAVGDINGDATGDLIVAAGFGGGPRVAVFDGKSVGPTPVKLFGDFFVFEPTLTNGAFVAVGDLNGDGFADLVAGGGPGGGPRVLALSGKDLMAGTKTPLANFFAGDSNNRGGVRVAVADLDGDNRADLVAGSGTGNGSRVTLYLGKNVTANGIPPEQSGFDAFPGYTGGVFVG